MRILFLLVILLPLVALAGFQTNDFRSVNGKLYNASYSTNWNTLTALLEKSGNFPPQDKIIINAIVVDRFTTNGVMVDITAERISGVAISDPEYWKSILIKNYPDLDNLTLRESLDGSKIRVMKVKPVEHLETYDCGLPAKPPDK